MGQIFFDNYIKLKNFNLNNKDEIDIPINNNDTTKDSIIYSIASSDFYDEKNKLLFAIYKPTSFTSDKFTIYRDSIDDDYMTYLGTVENVTDGVIDYGVASNKRYRYTIQTNPQYNSNISIQTDYLNVHWNKWSIVSLNYDIENDVYYPDSIVFTFENNLNVGAISDNMNFIKYNTLDKFGKIIQTPQRYESGSLTCLFGGFQYFQGKNQQYAYYDNDEKMILWRQFLQDQKVKLLKSPKGDMWVVSISEQTSREVQYNSISYPTTISFNWQEVIDKDKISILSW